MSKRVPYEPLPSIEQGLKVRRISHMPSGEMYVTSSDGVIFLWSRVGRCWVKAS